MPITTEQALARRNKIGSSDIAAILGIDPYRTAADIYWQKVGNIPVEERGGVGDYKSVGNYLEGPIKDWAEAELGPMERDVYREHCSGILAANLDGVLIEKPQIIEAKTCNILGPSPERELFGEEGTDEVPERVILQVHHQFFCVGPEYQVCMVPVLIGGRGFCMFRIEQNHALAVRVGLAGLAFWRDFVETRTPPPDSMASLETLKAIWRPPGSTARVDAGLILAWDAARQARLDAEKAEKEIKTELVNALGDAEYGEAEGMAVTYKRQSRKGYFVEPTEFPVLRKAK